MRPIMSKLAGEMASSDALYVDHGAAERSITMPSVLGCRPGKWPSGDARWRGRAHISSRSIAFVVVLASGYLATQLSRWTNDLEMLTAYWTRLGVARQRPSYPRLRTSRCSASICSCMT